MNEYAILISVGIMELFVGASITIGMTNIVSNGSGLLFVEAQQQQNSNVVSIGNCVTIGDNTTLGTSVTIGDNTTIAENMRIADNVRIGENITMTGDEQTHGNASSPITSPQNTTAAPFSTQINISC
jgi:UDP-3-O-[3-hydroxymyristoyl] glucosamine N-acyltransferase